MTPAFDQLERVRAFAAPARCRQCGDWMIAPVSSEFVMGGEIRHHWECDGCGQATSTVVEIARTARTNSGSAQPSRPSAAEQCD